jgi:general secretion pathway protein E
MRQVDADSALQLGLCWLDAAEVEDADWRFDLLSQGEAQRRGVLPLGRADGDYLLLADGRDLATRMWASAQPHGWRLAVTASGLVEQRLVQANAETRVLQDVVSGPQGDDDAQTVLEISRQGLAQESNAVIRLVDSTLFDALKTGASDVHVESTQQGLVIRYRVDGLLQHAGQWPGLELAMQVVSRLKILSGLDIGERRVPQDGRFSIRIESRPMDIRVSVIPTLWGEDVVMRLLDTSQMADRLSLEALGVNPVSARVLRSLIARPHGMLLVTGPTGSGKTTTLYAMLGELPQDDEKIITIEDPVEYQLPGVMQIPVNDRKGLTFARGLRAIMRHDPDTILVGEIRDGETAGIAIQSALTGHRVMSSIHANGVFSVIERFRFFAIEPHSLAEALNGVLAQRLVRRLCRHCAVAEPGSAEPWLRLGLNDPALADRALYRAVGCDQCQGSGFKGRMAILESLVFDSALRTRLAQGVSPSELLTSCPPQLFRPMHEDAIAAVLDGETTIGEVARVLDPV